jgi:hypothetical protein
MLESSSVRNAVGSVVTYVANPAQQTSHEQTAITLSTTGELIHLSRIVKCHVLATQQSHAVLDSD